MAYSGNTVNSIELTPSPKRCVPASLRGRVSTLRILLPTHFAEESPFPKGPVDLFPEEGFLCISLLFSIIIDQREREREKERERTNRECTLKVLHFTKWCFSNLMPSLQNYNCGPSSVLLSLLLACPIPQRNWLLQPEQIRRRFVKLLHSSCENEFLLSFFVESCWHDGQVVPQNIIYNKLPRVVFFVNQFLVSLSVVNIVSYMRKLIIFLWGRK